MRFGEDIFAETACDWHQFCVLGNLFVGDAYVITCADEVLRVSHVVIVRSAECPWASTVAHLLLSWLENSLEFHLITFNFYLTNVWRIGRSDCSPFRSHFIEDSWFFYFFVILTSENCNWNHLETWVVDSGHPPFASVKLWHAKLLIIKHGPFVENASGEWHLLHYLMPQHYFVHIQNTQRTQNWLPLFPFTRLQAVLSTSFWHPFFFFC